MTTYYLEYSTNDEGYTTYRPAPEVALYNRIATAHLNDLFHGKGVAKLT